MNSHEVHEGREEKIFLGKLRDLRVLRGVIVNRDQGAGYPNNRPLTHAPWPLQPAKKLEKGRALENNTISSHDLKSKFVLFPKEVKKFETIILSVSPSHRACGRGDFVGRPTLPHAGTGRRARTHDDVPGASMPRRRLP